MEYVLRLCEALPVRIWMTHYSTPTHPLPQMNSSSSQTPSVLLWHSPSALFRVLSPNYDCLHLEFTHTFQNYMYASKHIQTHTHSREFTHTEGGLWWSGAPDSIPLCD